MSLRKYYLKQYCPPGTRSFTMNSSSEPLKTVQRMQLFKWKSRNTGTDDRAWWLKCWICSHLHAPGCNPSLTTSWIKCSTLPCFAKTQVIAFYQLKFLILSEQNNLIFIIINNYYYYKSIMIVVKQFEWINELEWTKWQIGIIASTSSLLKSQNRHLNAPWNRTKIAQNSCDGLKAGSLTAALLNTCKLSGRALSS